MEDEYWGLESLLTILNFGGDIVMRKPLQSTPEEECHVFQQKLICISQTPSKLALVLDRSYLMICVKSVM